MIDKCQGCGRRERHEVPVGCLQSLQAQLSGVQFHTLQNLMSRLDNLEEVYAELLRRLDEYMASGPARDQKPTG